jgi:DNA primase
MFPIRDELGRIVGFSGRTLSREPTVAKYVNSPESPLFRKSHLLYALDRARRDIADAHEAIICEGQIDVIRCHQAGFKTAVAAQGTAFTEDHARILKRYADGAILVFDGDTAGTKAAIKTARILLAAGLSARVASLPAGEDPDSFLLKQGATAFRQALAEAGSIIAFHLRAMQRAENPDSPIGLARMTASLFETVMASPSPILRDGMIEEIARLTLRDILVLKREFQRVRSPAPSARGAAPQAPAPAPIPPPRTHARRTPPGQPGLGPPGRTVRAAGPDLPPALPPVH